VQLSNGNSGPIPSTVLRIRDDFYGENIIWIIID